MEVSGLRPWRLWPVLGALSAAVVIASFHAVGRDYYQGFRIRHGIGMGAPLSEELSFYTLFFVFGLAAMLLFTLALSVTSLPAVLLSAGRTMAAWPRLTATLAAAVLLAGCALVAGQVLRGGVLTDDEHVYRFIAQTLRTGSVTAPSPGTDLAFFSEQFVVVNDKVRYGKYPIGFPLLLAAGQALRLERLVVPGLTAVVAVLLSWVGRKEFPVLVAPLALALFVGSPQVLLTGASLLAQPAAAVALMAGIGCLLELERGRGRSMAWAAGAGVAMGYGIVVRPLPGVLFAGVALALFALGRASGAAPRLTLRAGLAFLVPLSLLVASVPLVNALQSGHPLVSGYQAIHGSNLVTTNTLAGQAMSMVSSLVRLDFWLFGWPLSLFFCLFARRTFATLLFWGMLFAELAYRVIAAKAGVGIAGPIYFYEVVPLLCLLAADGMVRLARGTVSGGLARALADIFRPQVLVSLLLAGWLVDLTMFLPFRLADLARNGQAQEVVTRLIEAKGLHHALVFHRTVVPPELGLSWAYFPRPNSPSLDDDVLFLLLPTGPGGVPRAVELWRRRFPDREAWVFGWDMQSTPFLVPLTEVEGSATGP